jgi:hypothetical protein
MDGDEPLQKSNSAFPASKEFAKVLRLARPTTPHLVKPVGNDEQ